MHIYKHIHQHVHVCRHTGTQIHTCIYTSMYVASVLIREEKDRSKRRRKDVVAEAKSLTGGEQRLAETEVA